MGMRRLRPLAALLLCAAFVAGPAASPRLAEAQQLTPCDQQGTSGRSVVTAKPRYGFMPQDVVSIPSELDGAAIQIGILRPDVPAGTRVPVIAHISPYFHPLQQIDLRLCSDFLAENYVPQGYAVALVALRGSGDSGGCFELFGFRERADLNQAVTWLGTQPWSNGRVGIAGKSSDGASAWEVASFGNPYLKTIVPVSGVIDIFDLMFGGGTVDFRGPGVISAVYFAQSLAYVQGRTPQHTVDVAACPHYAVAEAAGLYSAITGEEDPFGYWGDRRYTGEILEKYRGSVFFIHGLEDWNVNPGTMYPFIEQLRRRGVTVKTMLGQWGHLWPDEAGGTSHRADFADILLRWFDRYLKGRDAGTGPAVQVEDSAGRWRNERRWPPAGTAVRYALSPTGAMGPAPAPEGSVTVAVDPGRVQDPAGNQGAGIGQPPIPPQLQALCAPPLCAPFRTPPMPGTFRIAGLPEIRLTAVPMGNGGQLSAFLYAEGPGGLRRIGWGQVDLRFPTGRASEATAAQPGAPVQLRFRLQPLDAVVEPGERLVLMVGMASTSDRLPGPNLPITLELGGASGLLTLNRVSPAPGQFFEPPPEPEV